MEQVKKTPRVLLSLENWPAEWRKYAGEIITFCPPEKAFWELASKVCFELQYGSLTTICFAEMEKAMAEKGGEWQVGVGYNPTVSPYKTFSRPYKATATLDTDVLCAEVARNIINEGYIPHVFMHRIPDDIEDFKRLKVKVTNGEFNCATQSPQYDEAGEPIDHIHLIASHQDIEPSLAKWVKGKIIPYMPVSDYEMEIIWYFNGHEDANAPYNPTVAFQIIAVAPYSNLMAPEEYREKLLINWR